MDITIQSILGLVAVIVLFKMAFYTIKKVVLHIVTGYIVYYLATTYLQVPIDLSLLMWALMALFGPLPIIAVVLWHYFGS